MRTDAQAVGPSAMNGFSDGASKTSCTSSISPAATGARSRTWSPMRTPTRGRLVVDGEHAVGQVVDVERRPGGALDPARHAPLPVIGRGDQAELDEVVVRLEDAAAAERP